jgi:iron complex transport system substrate-binding protein
MNQRAWARALPALLLALGAACGGCKQRPASSAKRPTVASLVPSATDLLIGMGAGDHLVAISNFDPERGETSKLARVGDYQSLDWEQLAELRPDVLVVFIAPDRVPPALVARTRSMNIRIVNIHTERLDDIFQTITALGDAVDEKPKAQAALDRLRGQLDAVARRVAGLPRVPTLIVRDASGMGVVGRDTFLDDLLHIAGGENVITAKGWPTIDGEQLRSLNAQAILQLLPDASPQVLQQAQRDWRNAPEVPAVKEGRVYTFAEWYAQVSGIHVGDLAEAFADRLHSHQGSTTRATGGQP